MACNRHFPIYRNVKRSPDLLPEMVMRRQRDSPSQSSFRAAVWTLALQRLQCSRLSAAEFPDVYCGAGRPKPGQCELVTGSGDEFLGAWTVGKYPDQTLYVSACRPDTMGMRLAAVMRNCQIVDVCGAEDSNGARFTLFAAHSASSGTSHVQAVPRTDDASAGSELGALRLEFEHVYFYSCACSPSSKTAALGSNRGVIVSGLDELGGPGSAPRVFGRRTERFTAHYCLDFDPKGSLLYFGFWDGAVASADRRCRGSGFIAEVPTGGKLSHIKLLDDGVSLIASASDNKLSYVDLRRNSVVFSYPGHVSRSRKIPFCADQSAGIVCASGEDLVTRYWSLREGRLLAEFHPPFSPDARPSSYMYSSVRLQKRTMRSYLFAGSEIHALESQL